jgi:hypothetical protein
MANAHTNSKANPAGFIPGFYTPRRPDKTECVNRTTLPGVAALLLIAFSLPAADPVFPYGAVYFRKSNPPEQDWARDHATAARIGMNTFRHWFMWESIEVAPGKYDWADYDRMMTWPLRTASRW